MVCDAASTVHGRSLPSRIASMLSFHTLNGIIALLSGLGIILVPKGTLLHRRAGYLYVASMYLLCVVSLGIRDTTPFFRSFGAFHIMALVSTATITVGLLPVLRRPRPANWYDLHFRFMLWSYVGLVMAFVTVQWIGRRVGGAWPWRCAVRASVK